MCELIGEVYGKKMLDLGCGDARFARDLFETGGAACSAAVRRPLRHPGMGGIRPSRLGGERHREGLPRRRFPPASTRKPGTIGGDAGPRGARLDGGRRAAGRAADGRGGRTIRRCAGDCGMGQGRCGPCGDARLDARERRRPLRPACERDEGGSGSDPAEAVGEPAAVTGHSFARRVLIWMAPRLFSASADPFPIPLSACCGCGALLFPFAIWFKQQNLGLYTS
jgi:hypothetical protein